MGRCGLLGAGVMLKKVCPWEWALRSQKLKSGPVTHSPFLLPADADIELSAPSLALCLPVYHQFLP